MKNINNYAAEKYAEPNDLKYNEGNTNKYKKIAEGIYSFFDE